MCLQNSSQTQFVFWEKMHLQVVGTPLSAIGTPAKVCRYSWLQLLIGYVLRFLNRVVVVFGMNIHKKMIYNTTENLLDLRYATFSNRLSLLLAPKNPLENCFVKMSCHCFKMFQLLFSISWANRLVWLLCNEE